MKELLATNKNVVDMLIYKASSEVYLLLTLVVFDFFWVA